MGVSVFQWNAEHFPSGGGSFAFEALLFDNGDILFQYATGNTELGSGSTTGVQDISASIGLAYACNEPLSILEQFAVLITRTPPPVDGNAQFAVTKGSFDINWAAHELESPEDTLDLQVLFNPAGMVPDITGATLRIAIRGSEILPATSLDARGSVSSEQGAFPSFSVRVDTKGKLKAKFTGLDLRGATGLFNQDGTGLVDLPIEITITGAGLLQEELNAIATFSYATQLDRATKATTALNKAGNLTPVFIPLKVKVTEVPGVGHVVQVSKAILQFSASAPALPIDLIGVSAAVRVEVGSAEPLEVPYASLRVRGEGSRSLVTYLATLFDVVGLSSLNVKNSSRSISFSTGALADTGLPEAQAEGAPLEHDLQIGLLFHTDIGLVRAYSTVRVKRKSTFSGSWSN